MWGAWREMSDKCGGSVEECVAPPPHSNALSPFSILPHTFSTPQHTSPFLPRISPLLPYFPHNWPNTLNYQKFPYSPTIHARPNSLYSSILPRFFPILPHTLSLILYQNFSLCSFIAKFSLAIKYSRNSL